MGKIDSSLLTEAVRLWTGWGRLHMPSQDLSALRRRYGANQASELLTVIEPLIEEFYQSGAKDSARDLVEMGEIAKQDFKKKYPELPDEISEAFAWCYTFDYK
jgi:hypothetical protein